MKRTLALVVLLTSILFSQTDFWSHYSLNVPVSRLINYGDSLFLAVSNYDVLKSTNLEEDWESIYSSEDTCQYWTYLNLYAKQINSAEIYLIIKQVNGSSGCVQPPVLISTNTGYSWQELSLPGQSFRDIDIMNNGTLVYLNEDTTYYSDDLGTTWNYLNIPYLGTVEQIEVNSNDWIYVTKHFQYFDEWTWTMFDYEILYSSTDNGQNWNSIAGTNQWPMEGFFNIFHTNDGETIASEGPWNWKVFYDNMIICSSFPLEYGVNSAVTIENKYFFSSEGITNPILYYSSDSGQTWIIKNEGLSNLNDFNTIIKDKFGYLYLGTDQGIYKSNFSQLSLFQTNTLIFNDTKIGDTTYKQVTISNPLTSNLYIDSLIIQNQESFIVSAIDSVLEPGNNILLVGFIPSQFGELTSILTIYTDFVVDEIELLGSSPIPTMTNLPFNNDFGDVQIGDTASLTISLTSQSINTIRIDSIYLQTGQYFFVNQLEYPLYLNENDTVYFSIVFIPLTQSVLPKQDNIKILSNAQNSPLSLLVKGRGVNPNDVEIEGLINSFNLSECYPNPFNPTTTVEYQVPKTSKVKISVFNLVGEEITVLVNEEKPQGKYTIEFNGTNLPSGVYFYRMQAENFTSTKKFVLLK